MYICVLSVFTSESTIESLSEVGVSASVAAEVSVSGSGGGAGLSMESGQKEVSDYSL